jgi:hypothetical protein
VRKRLVALPLLGMVFLCLFGVALWGQPVAPQVYDDQKPDQVVYAYRDWQSTIYTLHAGDSYHIEAEGSWMYSPEVGHHGPEGSRYHLAPESYPMPYAPGGVLIGRIGESGQPFRVGKEGWGIAEGSGKLYLRINDDRLGDNAGSLALDLQVEQAPGGGGADLPDALPLSTPSYR